MATNIHLAKYSPRSYISNVKICKQNVHRWNSIDFDWDIPILNCHSTGKSIQYWMDSTKECVGKFLKIILLNDIRMFCCSTKEIHREDRDYYWVENKLVQRNMKVHFDRNRMTINVEHNQNRTNRDENQVVIQRPSDNLQDKFRCCSIDWEDIFSHSNSNDQIVQ